MKCQPCRKDCPRRTAFCKRSCPEWREWETIERPARYAKAEEERLAAYPSQNAKRNERKALRDRARRIGTM